MISENNIIVTMIEGDTLTGLWLQKFPELKFKYVEEEAPEEFFIPYMWSLVYHSSNLYFNATKIILFSLSSWCDLHVVPGVSLLQPVLQRHQDHPLLPQLLMSALNDDSFWWVLLMMTQVF